MAAIADMISEVLLDIKNLDTAHKVSERVRELTARFPLAVLNETFGCLTSSGWHHAEFELISNLGPSNP